ncbi:RAMP superfamily CRISPR-associated protein [Laspinema olomoucense]|uniref:RAMP superfamily CRISPR-associated protein n=1 Tax=Laspinema olomoucense D3b TaxID=2953688 RepID=A0ABT2NCL5_9CYAN|nr:RAMP superfamily CRISPR-associated protein [Laspinema sp. D3b]MCT7980433.1 RAMP superfamily CRISPR-associated protein [Laspinema sp. D3b]
MAPNAVQPPKKPEPPKKLQPPATPLAGPTPVKNTAKPKPPLVIPPVGAGNQGGGGGGNSNSPPSPWLCADREPQPDRTASFVEYLRWMRSPDSPQKDGTKVQILQIAEEKAQYQQRLQQLCDRTQAIAGKDNTFQVKCPWRIRVGGHRGPESILLPAFDALGMPYIPSATLRGVARTQAIRERMAAERVGWKEAEKQTARWFGSLDAKGSDRCGKVVFLDAYPLPNKAGLKVDMANNIWKWEGESLPIYDPNPNPFFSLEEPTFLIGLRLVNNCSDAKILDQVKAWLVTGLQGGIGSQVNSGYGELIRAGAGQPKDEFFRLEFTLQGQLIHGRQKFTQWNWNDRRQEWQMRGQPDSEVRPIAFKSMLRYWFRSFTLGVLPPEEVQRWEAQFFGGINPKQWGWLRVEILEGKVTQREPSPNHQGKNDDCGEQVGILVLRYSPEAPGNRQQAISSLFKTLTWMMFHLGGIGQGARRPCYSRQNRERAPWYRGSTLYPETKDSFWNLPDTIQEFKQRFQQRLQEFYQALNQVTQLAVNPRSPLQVGQVTSNRWSEAVDRNCRIVVVSGQNQDKPYALNLLHQEFHNLENNKNFDQAKSLCGGVQRGAVPSPIWIADLDAYQVVTVFGATADPRKNYLNLLRQPAQIWPMT